MEGNPKDPYLYRHKQIFNLKTKKCLVFSLQDDKFLLMDNNYYVYKLSRNPNDR